MIKNTMIKNTIFEVIKDNKNKIETVVVMIKNTITVVVMIKNTITVVVMIKNKIFEVI